MKTAISVPDRIFDAAEKAAHRLKMSRSELYSKAVERYVAAEGGSDVTLKLDAIYDREDSRLGPDLVAIQALSLTSEPSW